MPENRFHIFACLKRFVSLLLENDINLAFLHIEVPQKGAVRINGLTNTPEEKVRIQRVIAAIPEIAEYKIMVEVANSSGGRKALPNNTSLNLLGRGEVYPRPPRTGDCSNLPIGIAQIGICYLFKLQSPNGGHHPINISWVTTSPGLR